MIYVFSSRVVSHVLRVDDPLDCIAVHLFCGCAGMMMAPAFARSKYYRLIYTVTDDTSDERISGFFFGGDGRMLACALVTALAILAWVLGHMIPFFMVLRVTGQFRTDPEEERAGVSCKQVDKRADSTCRSMLCCALDSVMYVRQHQHWKLHSSRGTIVQAPASLLRSPTSVVLQVLTSVTMVMWHTRLCACL